MNDKIKELLKQAVNRQTVHVSDLDSKEKIEKFAMLIIEECVAACGKHEDVESFGIYPFRVAVVTMACEENIKRHFGVE